MAETAYEPMIPAIDQSYSTAANLRDFLLSCSVPQHRILAASLLTLCRITREIAVDLAVLHDRLGD